jgi:hypothetical protein
MSIRGTDIPDNRLNPGSLALRTKVWNDCLVDVKLRLAVRANVPNDPTLSGLVLLSSAPCYQG